MIDENIIPKNKMKNSSSSSSIIINQNKQQKGRTIEEMYQKKSQLEHILLRPDTYVGSVEKQTQQMWVYDSNTQKMIMKSCTFVPGLYKIFDEIIVNAADNKQRDPTMSRIEVDINPDENTIRVWNNGAGIPIAIHQEHNIYVPELIFGHLLTGSNFDDDEQKTTGGRNGYGAKLANIFSSEFIIETADHTRGLKFKQIFRKNMTERSEPEIKKYTGSDFTSVTFKPDLERFKMDFLDDDIVSLLSKRVFDIAGTNLSTGVKLNIFLNNTKININSFQQYLSMFNGLSEPCAFEKVNDKWEVGVAVSDGSFQQVSYVNSICTTKGGQHVNYIVDQITQKLAAAVKKKNKGEEVKPTHIKNHIAVFVNSLIVNPAFDSQTKENLTTKSSSFGSTCPLSDKFLKKIENSGVIDNILSWAKFKQTAELKKKGGSKKSKLIGITKLDDANFAGTSKSKDCTLILTEGDSAKALAISGLGVVGRDYYGVFPLKGKLLNVREATHAQIMKNEEIQNVAKILGLTFGKVYEETSSLRYGHLMIMTDQDHDGSHIKGLLINFLHHFWPSLLQIDGFLQQFITPIVKCTKGSKELPFYTIPEYLKWKEENNDGKGWKVKYYKGLGTSTSAEAKDYFSNLDTHEIDFSWNESSNDAIEMAFSKKRVDDRKQWLLAMDPDIYIDYDVDSITYDKFVNEELILFSHADNQRSIPHLIDGFKPSQRKVLFSCFKRNLKQEIKVAQLAGYVSEHSAYHHGEASLTQTIIGMAQNFVGCGNINLLTPCGQFGTRLMGGKDAASPRYVFTKLETITRCIFHPDDDYLLNYLDDDGQSIEPEYYVPIIPMVLVNGSEGIGTGWSTSIPTYNPRDIIHNLKALITQDGSEINLHPWYRGFTGEVKAKTGRDSNNYVVSGIINQIDESTVVISELPVGKSTTDYKQFLESMLIGAAENGIIKEFKENHTDTTVLFTITLPPEKLIEINNESGGLVKKFKIEGSTATSNMHVFDVEGKITKFEKADDIMKSFYEIRMSYYEKRKNYLASKFSEEWEKIDNRVRFILAVVHGELVVSNRKKKDLLAELKREGYKMFFPTKKSAGSNNDQQQQQQDNDNDNDENSDNSEDMEIISTNSNNLDKGYDYLLSMKIWNLTQEKVDELCKERDTKRDALDTLMRKDPGQLWLEDLETLEVALDEFEDNIEKEKKSEIAARKKATKAGNKKRGGAQKISKKRTNKYNSDEDSDEDHDNDNMSQFDESEFEEKKSSKSKSKVSVKNNTTTKTTTQANKAPLTITTTKPASVVEKVSVESGLTLAQRLLSKIDLNSTTSTNTTIAPVSSILVAPTSKTTTSKTTTNSKKTNTTVETKKRETKKTSQKKVNDNEDKDDVDDNDNESVEILPVKEKSTRSAAVAALKNVYNLADESDEEISLHSEDDEDDSDSSHHKMKGKKKHSVEESEDKDEDEDEFIESSEESDYSDDSDTKRKKKTTSKTTKVSKETKATKESKSSKSSTATTKQTLTKSKNVSEEEQPPKVSKKRQTKATTSTTSTTINELYSPGVVTPREVKKPRKQANKNSNIDRMESLIQTNTEKPVAKTAPQKKTTTAAAKTTGTSAKSKSTTSKTNKTARRIAESSDEEDEVEEVVFVPKKSPKPVRNTRKVIKSYAVDSDIDDDEEDEYNSDNSDEESDFEEE